MPADTPLSALDTERLILRRSEESDAVVFRQLWTERDGRVPPHRQIDAAGRPSTEDIAANLRSKRADMRPGLLTVVRRDLGDVIGYCGVVFDGNGEPDEPELAFELLQAVHNRGYATEAGQAVLAWADSAGCRRVWASVWDWNLASRRALEKLGFIESGRAVKESEHGRSLLTVREL